jgi:hypothetical protein
MELGWSKMKAWLRKAKSRTKEALGPAIAEEALDAITPNDCKGWIRRCGYELQ